MGGLPGSHPERLREELAYSCSGSSGCSFDRLVFFGFGIRLDGGFEQYSIAPIVIEPGIVGMPTLSKTHHEGTRFFEEVS